MHPAAALFLTRCHIPQPDPLAYEVGAADHNGRARDYLPTIGGRWVGFDLLPGPNVDVVGDAALTLPDHSQCDVMVSTEVLEHAENWVVLLHRMCASVRSGGWLVVTCAGPGREPHSADGGPLQPGEHYRNISANEIECTAVVHGFVPLIVEQVGGDSRFFGRKGSAAWARPDSPTPRVLEACA